MIKLNSSHNGCKQNVKVLKISISGLFISLVVLIFSMAVQVTYPQLLAFDFWSLFLHFLRKKRWTCLGSLNYVSKGIITILYK